jgi:hypothetical protein
MRKNESQYQQEFEDLLAALTLGALSREAIEGVTRELIRQGTTTRQPLAALYRVFQSLGQLLPPVTPPPTLQERLLQSASNRDTARHVSSPTLAPAVVFIRADEDIWQEMGPGVTAKMLCTDPVTGSFTALVRMAAGSRCPVHLHVGIEELFILEGECYCAGSYLLSGDYYRIAGENIPRTTFTERGCLIFLRHSIPDLNRAKE